MDDWQQDWVKVLEMATGEVERLFLSIAKEVNEAADALIDFSEEVAEQVERAIAPTAAYMDDHIDSQFDDWLEPLMLALTGLENVVGEAAAPVTRTVEPMLNQHPACMGCRHYHGQNYGGNILVCGMHPYGWDAEKCPDWESAW
jgi:hypothetical protein